MIVAEGGAVAGTGEIFVEADGAEPLHRAGGLAVEADEIGQHGPEAGAEQIAFLGEEAAEVGAGIFEAALL